MATTNMFNVPEIVGSRALPKLQTTAQGSMEFLACGGEMGARMRAFDWHTNPLGTPDNWPHSLKTIIRIMLDSRYAMWLLWGPELTFFCNDAYLPTVGIKQNWVLGARSDKVWEEIWPDIGPRIAQVLERGQSTWDEGLLLFLERSGFREETYHTFSYSPVYDDASVVAGMLCVVTEVTERVIGERRLRALRDLATRGEGTKSVVETCAHTCKVLAKYSSDVPFVAMYLLDDSAQHAQRYACSCSLPLHVLPETVSLDAAETPWPLRSLIQSRKVQTLENLPAHGLVVNALPWSDPVQTALFLPLNAVSKRDLTGFLLVGVSPRRALDEAYRSFFELVANQVTSLITDAQAYEAERRRAESLAELDRAKTLFFSNVSHEFRTPLTLMIGPLEAAIAEHRTPANVRSSLVLALRNAERLRKLVNSLLDFSRIEAKRVQATFEPLDLAALTRDLASTFQSAMEQAGLIYKVDCPPLAHKVFVDREMWEKIVLNLLSNAFKFTLEGSVTVILRAVDEWAELKVIDTGVGVPATEVPRLFERFHRIESTRGRTFEGSGIGLALVQELVRLHGGMVDAVSSLGCGTSFRVCIPFGSAHLPKDRIRAPRLQASTALEARTFVQEALRWLPQVARENPPMLIAENSPADSDRRFASTFGARIVLADDNADMRTYISELLSPFYQVEALADGAQALLAAQRQRPDLILTDLMMPSLDGFGLLAAIRNDMTLRNVPVVFLSARAGEDARIEGLDAGADDYLVKPFSARELATRIGSLLELRSMRRAAEHDLELRTAQFETLLNVAPLGVYLVDADFKIREINPTARSVFGNISDLVGSNFADVIQRQWPTQYVNEIIQHFKQTLETGKPHHEPERIEPRLDRGVTESYEWQIHRIPLPDGRHGVVCYFRDISQHVQVREKLKAADRQKDEFLAMLAHELRNPLAPIRTAADILAVAPSGDSSANRAISIIQRQVVHLTRLVDDLLDVSRITRGYIELKRETIHMSDLVGQALEVAQPLFTNKQHTVQVSNDPTIWINGDPARLVQCFANVLTNAAKYTDHYGTIRLAYQKDGNDVVVSISDTGIGIAPSLLPHVFDLFIQANRTLDRAQGGLGIGLAVVRRLIEMHGGSVIATSPGVNQGTTITLRLPLDQTRLSVPKAIPEKKTFHRRVLVVDDNADAADSLAMLLQAEGHDATTAYSGHEALIAVNTQRPEVILLDIGLPTMDGYEVARQIRLQYGPSAIRLVALTGYGQAEDQARARAAGFDQHLTKPAAIEALREALNYS